MLVRVQVILPGRKWAVGVLAGAAAALLAAGCSVVRSTPVGASNVPGATIFPSGQRAGLPAVSGQILTGGKFRLAADRGHVIVLNFWGSWCSVCQQEAPALAAAARQFAPSGVRFVGVDVADNPASALAYMQHHGLGYPSLSDQGDRIAAEFNRIIPVAAFPSTLVISPGGRIAGRVIGAASDYDLRRLIEAAG
jgi:thiol-disulfide isomerase/thioredoxin